MVSEGNIPKMFKKMVAKKETLTVNGHGDGDFEMESNSGNKRLSVERIYQKKTQLEHIILRPDTYIGSIEKTTQPMWVYDELAQCMVQRDITFVPGLYKIFDEILVNAADNKQRDSKMNCLKIDIDAEKNMIKIWNNGKGIPVVHHAKENMFVPTLIFGHLLTSSNYDDSEKKVTGGRNGYGAKLCNIFSTKFTIETQSSEYKSCFKQTWTDNMTKAGEPKISPSKGDDYTCVTFHPDLGKFGMDKLDKDIVDLFCRRAYDIAGSTDSSVRVFLNGNKLSIKTFKEYAEMYLKDKLDDESQPLKLIHEVASPRWEVAIANSDKGFQQVSFVNSIATTKGGKHVDHVVDQIVAQLIETVKKREKKNAMAIKPFQVKNHIWIFVNALIENPAFDSQTKENMTLQAKSFGSKCTLSDKFYNNASKCGIIESIQSWMRFKQQTMLNSKSGSKRSKLRGIAKLDDANDAGTKNSSECTLILTEGDSAKTLAVAGLGVVGRDRYGVFPLRGKVLNVREATHKQILENAEINNIIKIIGLQYKQQYDTPESLKSLRYGRLMIMTDQDQDGSHIKGLLINFIHHNWPKLLQHKFIEEFITPIVKVSKNKQEKSFYSLPEFEEWKQSTSNWHTWKVKYYKGLGTSTAKEAKEYFSDMQRHRIPFKYGGPQDDDAIVLAFSKKKCEERKEWLTAFMEDRKRRTENGQADIYLYGKDTNKISYNEFVNKELILYSNMDNERSIPSLVDGFKPGQRKVIFTCFKRNLVKELKVAQLAGSVAELSSYHHGEQSLMSTIVGLAQNFVGSNNLNLLLPIGQFGTRLTGGKDSASPRYIFTMLSSLTRMIFHPHDDALLNFLQDDTVKIEPEWYIPIIPMILVNGSEGIGTGWSTKIPNYDVRDIITNIKRLLEGRELLPMIPSFKHFRGSIEKIDEHRYITNGEIYIINDETIEITELPIRTWTQVYKEGVLEPMVQGTEKVPAFINDYKEYHTDTTVKFVVKMSSENLDKASQQGLHNFFKLQTSLTTTSMVLFDANGCIKRYESVEEIMKDFYELRLTFYSKRKIYLEGMLSAEALKLFNQARFICEKIDKIIFIENVAKKELIKKLLQCKYDSDPVKAWKLMQAKLQSNGLDNISDNEEGENTEGDEEKGPDYHYILNMPLWSLTKERKEDLLRQRDAKANELEVLKKKTPKDLWIEDLDNLSTELEKVEQQEKDDQIVGPVKSKTSKVKKIIETKPSPNGHRVIPIIDAIKNKFDALKTANAKKKIKKETFGENEVVVDDEGNQIRPLADRLNMSSENLKKESKKLGLKVSKPRKPKLDDSSKKSPKKKEKKTNPWSDDDESDDDGHVSMMSDSDEEIANNFVNNNLPKNTNPRRAAAAKAKYKFSDDENDEDYEKSHNGVTNQLKHQLNSDDDDEPLVKSSDGNKNSDNEDEDFFQNDGKLLKRPLASTTKNISNDEQKTKSKFSKPINTISSEDELHKSIDLSDVVSENSLLNGESDDSFKLPSKKPTTEKKPSNVKKQTAAPSNKSAKPKTVKSASAKVTKPFVAKVNKPAASKAPPKRKNEFDLSDDDDEKSTKSKKAKGKKGSDFEDDDFKVDVPLRERIARATRAPVSYKFDDDEEDEE